MKVFNWDKWLTKCDLYCNFTYSGWLLSQIIVGRKDVGFWLSMMEINPTNNAILKWNIFLKYFAWKKKKKEKIIINNKTQNR